MKKFKNRAEGLLQELLEAEGWEVSKRGWPDFICFKGDQVMIVEVKPKGEHGLKMAQSRVMKVLAAAGLDVRRWSVDTGFDTDLDKTVAVVREMRAIK